MYNVTNFLKSPNGKKFKDLMPDRLKYNAAKEIKLESFNKEKIKDNKSIHGQILDTMTRLIIEDIYGVKSQISNFQLPTSIHKNFDLQIIFEVKRNQLRFLVDNIEERKAAIAYLVKNKYEVLKYTGNDYFILEIKQEWIKIKELIKEYQPFLTEWAKSLNGEIETGVIVGNNSGMISKGDLDFIVGDTLIDMKASKKLDMSKNNIAQLLIYYFMLIDNVDSKYEEQIKYIQIFNPLYKTTFTIRIGYLKDLFAFDELQKHFRKIQAVI